MRASDDFERIVRAINLLPEFSAFHVEADVIDPDRVEVSINGSVSSTADADARWELLFQLRRRALAACFVVSGVDELDAEPVVIAQFERTSPERLAFNPLVEILTLTGPPPPLGE